VNLEKAGVVQPGCGKPRECEITQVLAFDDPIIGQAMAACR
jgi:hypothetical protein